MTPENYAANTAPIPTRSMPNTPRKRPRCRIDLRTRDARRQAAYRLRFVQALADPEHRPYSRLPVLMRSAVDGAVALQMAMDRLSEAQARSEPVDPDAVVRTAGALARAVEAITTIAAVNQRAAEAAAHAEERRRLGLDANDRKPA